MKKSKSHIVVFILLSSLILTACPRKPEPISRTPYKLAIPAGFPTNLNIPTDNPMTVEGVRLGRYLFYDGRMSGRTDSDSLMSCYSCHRQDRAFESGPDHPRLQNGKMRGLTGVETFHSMMPLINLVFHESYMWNGMLHKGNQTLGGYGLPAQEPYNFKNLESFVWMMIAAPHEVDGDTGRTVEAIRAVRDIDYPEMFRGAYGTSEINIDRICKAIAQFLRILISGDSKFDKYMRGEVDLTDDELQGYFLFTQEIGDPARKGADCFHCHGGDGNILFSTYDYVNNALDAEADQVDSRDRRAVTGNERDKAKYKIPTLRNIALTAPYMHDGRFTTLEEVVDFYSEGLMNSPTVSPLMKEVKQGGVQLTPTQKRQLIAFLNTLTDETFITNPDFGPPEELKEIVESEYNRLKKNELLISRKPD